MMYVISIILPPFGLGWAVKYVRNENKTAQKIGITIIVLTILSLIANFYALYALYDSYASLLNPYSNLNF